MTKTWHTNITKNKNGLKFFGKIIVQQVVQHCKDYKQKINREFCPPPPEAGLATGAEPSASSEGAALVGLVTAGLLPSCGGMMKAEELVGVGVGVAVSVASVLFTWLSSSVVSPLSVSQLSLSSSHSSVDSALLVSSTES